MPSHYTVLHPSDVPWERHEIKWINSIENATTKRKNCNIKKDFIFYFLKTLIYTRQSIADVWNFPELWLGVGRDVGTRSPPSHKNRVKRFEHHRRVCLKIEDLLHSRLAGIDWIIHTTVRSFSFEISLFTDVGFILSNGHFVSWESVSVNLTSSCQLILSLFIPFFLLVSIRLR